MKVTTETSQNGQRQRVTTQLNRPSTAHRFVRFASRTQEEQVTERNNLSKLLELPKLFTSGNDYRHPIAETTIAAATEAIETAAAIDLKGASVSALDEVANARDNDTLSKLLSLGNPDLETFRGTATTPSKKIDLKNAAYVPINNRPGLSHKNPAILNMIAKEEAEQNNDKLSKLLELPGLFNSNK